MKKLIDFIKFPLLWGLILVPFAYFASGAAVGPLQTVRLAFTEADATAFADEPLNGTPQTSVIEVDGFRFVTFYVSLTRGGATDDVTMACNVGPTSTTVTYDMQSSATVAGTSTYSNLRAVKAVAAADDFVFTVPIDGFAYMQCSFTGANSTAADTLDLVIVAGIN